MSRIAGETSSHYRIRMSTQSNELIRFVRVSSSQDFIEEINASVRRAMLSLRPITLSIAFPHDSKFFPLMSGITNYSFHGHLPFFSLINGSIASEIPDCDKCRSQLHLAKDI